MSAKRVLIVDDEEALLPLLQKKLTRLDPSYEVLTARDGFSALEQLKQQDFDLVITDFKMPEMDGLELLTSIRSVHRAPPQAICSIEACPRMSSNALIYMMARSQQ